MRKEKWVERCSDGTSSGRCPLYHWRPDRARAWCEYYQKDVENPRERPSFCKVKVIRIEEGE